MAISIRSGRLFLAFHVIFFVRGYGQNWCDYQSTMAFAENLHKEGYIEDAILEIRRILFFRNGDSGALALLSHCICRAPHPENYLEFSRKTVKKITDTLICARFWKGYARKDMFEAALSIVDSCRVPPEVQQMWKAEIYLRMGKLHEAERLISGDKSKGKWPNLTSCLERIRNTSWKSPFLGGLFSALIPGAGRMYAGYWKDGFISLISIASIAGGTYLAWRHAGEVTGVVIFGATLTAALYLGNIYGGIKMTMWANKRKYEKIVAEELPPLDCR